MTVGQATSVLLWGFVLGSLLVWLLAVTDVLEVGPWVHLLLVVAVAFGLTGLLRGGKASTTDKP
ncbi:MAG TPA: hypothetical protein VLS89_14890 [Candidatus Nanopelagicales bacterium]|nr:hypothetical protein [Candidatus Nanopelagicales bacterium]